MSRGGGGGEGGGGGGRQNFLSAHRCPEVDLLPRQLSEEKASPACSPRPAEKSSGEAAYLDVCSTGQSDKDEDDEDMSDWSEEDLSLHFSPSVILQSEDEESDPESGFECVDVTMATQVRGPNGAVPKMVPKRQIQLKKKNAGDQVKQAPANVGGINNNASAVCPRADLFQRQHSMPASLHQTSNSEVTGPVGGANQGSLPGGRRLQKSLSLDETKTKLASSLIKSVLSKRMQEEKTTTTHLMNSIAPPTSAQQSGPIHIVRDVRSLLKNTSCLAVSTNSQVIGPKDSPPPTYQQAVRVKGDVRGVAQSRGRKPHQTSVHPAAEQRRGSEPIRRGNSDDVTSMRLDPTSVRTGDFTGRSQSKGSVAPSPPEAPGLPVPPRPTQPRPAGCVQDQTSIRGVSSQQPLQPCFYAAAPPPRLRTVSCVHGPLSCLPTQLPAPGLQNYDQLTGTVSGPPDRTASDQEGQRPAETLVQPRQQPLLCSFQGFLPAQMGGDFGVDVTRSTAAAPGAPFGSAPHLMVDPKTRQCFYLETPPQPQVKMLLDPETGQFVQVVVAAAGPASGGALYPVGYAHPAPTVLSPAHTVMNPAPVMLQVGGANHTMYSVMHLQPRVGVSSLYPFALQPLTVMTSHPTQRDDITPDTP